jgi:hypothetical protein
MGQEGSVADPGSDPAPAKNLKEDRDTNPDHALSELR